ncbi:hypothetical protein ACFX2I_022523 [Malus domestica]
MSEPPLKLLVRNRLLGTLPDCSSSRALEYSSSTSSASSSSLHLPGKQMMQVKMMHRSMRRQARRMHVLIVRYFFKSKSISYHWGRKQRYLISCSSPIFSFALAFACRTRRREAISRNLKLNVRSRTDCLQPLPGYLPGVALECSSSTADMSRIPSANASGVWIC